MTGVLITDIVDTWVLLGLTGALAIGFFNIYQKYLINEGHNPKNIIVDMHTVGAMVLIIPALLVPFNINTEIILLFVGSGLLNGISFWLLALAYEDGDLSLIAPLRGLTPILVAALEPLVFLDVQYELALILASIVVAIGLYVLTYEDSLKQTARRIMKGDIKKGLISSSVIAFAVIVDRYAIVETELHPVLYALYLMLSAIMFSTIIAYKKSDQSIQDIVIPEPITIPLGVLRGVSVSLAFGAFLFVEGTRVNIVWQLGAVIATLFGGTVLKEDDLLTRTIGVILIVMGAVVAVVI